MPVRCEGLSGWGRVLAALALVGLWGVALATPVAVSPSAPAGARSTVRLAAAGTSAAGKPLGWFAGWTLEGTVFNRTSLLALAATANTPPARGHALVFFATWCKPCEAGLRVLAASRARWSAAGIEVVLVAVGEDAAVVKPWLAARPELAPLLASATVLPDRFGVVSRDLAGIGDDASGRSSLPRTVVVDGAGVVRAVLGAEGDDYLALILAAIPPPAQSVAAP